MSGEFDEIAGELYGLPPDEFTSARDERVKQAKAAGDKALAGELGKLRRPTQAAWLVNLLWRDSGEQIEELLVLADDFGAAMAAGDGRQLQALTGTRRELETQLTRRTAELAADSGVTAGADLLREVQDTFGAALVSAEAAEELRSGRLVRPLSYSGFGPGLAAVGTAAPARRKGAPPGKPAGRTAAKSGKGTRARAGDRETETGEREAAEQELADAREAMSAAADELAARTAVAERAVGEYESLSTRLAELREQVRELDQQIAGAKQAASREQRRLDQAKKAYERARGAVERVISISGAGGAQR